jgi:hypothetical protein
MMSSKDSSSDAQNKDTKYNTVHHRTSRSKISRCDENAMRTDGSKLAPDVKKTAHPNSEAGAINEGRLFLVFKTYSQRALRIIATMFIGSYWRHHSGIEESNTI